jgi:lauroyl/myristoyl acyltransferase
MKRKKVFPKPPVRYHSKLAKELGKHSNKMAEANLKAIYTRSESNNIPKISHQQEQQLAKLKANLEKRKV